MNWPVILLMVLAGVGIAFQTPINGTVARVAGTYPATLLSFVVGCIVTLGVALVTSGTGWIRTMTTLSPWQFVGGLFGALYVSAAMLTVSRIGVTAMMIAGLFGQMAGALLIDSRGWFGLTARPIEPVRILGVVLVMGGVVLMGRK